ncbi:MAG: hypothetical protein NW200_04210 [Hyphomonadaceae bacterium]|nr:hypothetical protein [Hyphomonadaceae bacterium]
MLLVQSPAPDVRPAEPTPLVRLIAGAYAARVAALWPAPHGAYLEMPAQRRHLTHVVLDFGVAPPETLADALRYARADAVVRDCLGATPPGFVRLLGRLGEIAWAGEDYLRLLTLFEDEDARLVLRQSPAITGDGVRALEALAPALRAPAIVRHLNDHAAATLLDCAWRAIEAVHGAEAARAAARRWARAGETTRLFDMAAADMTPLRFDPAPFPVHPDLRRLGGAAALTDAGRRFRNCLATYQDRAADGAVALYEWAGPPPAAIALSRDGFFGWRLDEARGVGNAALDEDARTALIAALRAAGVRVGRSGRDIRAMLLRAAGRPHDWIDDLETDLTPFGL